MAQQYSSILFWICLFATCCNVRGQPNDTTTDAVVSTVPSAPAVTVNPPSGSVVVSGGSSSAATTAVNVPNPGSSTGAAGSSASSISPGSSSTTPAAKVVNCINGTKTSWNEAQNVSGSCQSSTGSCWVLATYAKKEVTQIKLSCAPKEQGTKCDKDECKYANDSCECCCSSHSCNNENFDEKCDGARASSKGVRLSPPWLSLVTLVLVMMKTL